MFSLLYGLWKYLFSKAEFHVLILGIDKAGKTTLLEKLKTLYSDFEGLPPDRIVPTVGLNIGRIEAHKSKLIFWDLGGQLGLRTIWEKYYEEAHAILYVVDAASESRLEDTKSAFVSGRVEANRIPDLTIASLDLKPAIFKHSLQVFLIKLFTEPSGFDSKPKAATIQSLLPEKVLRHQDLQGAPVLIFANKQDLEGAVSAEEIGSALNLKELEERQSMAMAISAYDGSGIREGVTWLVDAMRTCKRTQELKQRADAAVTMNMHIIKEDTSVWRKERIKNRVW